MGNRPISVTVRVPGTAANLGPGFDCLGLALDLHQITTVTLGPDLKIYPEGEGSKELPNDSANLVYQGVSLVYNEVGLEFPGGIIRTKNEIPIARGLGSSAAAIVSGLVAANALLNKPLDNHRLLHLATSLEGHPDNVAPAIFGGCQIVVETGSDLICTRVRVSPSLKTVLFVPDQPLPTQKARSILPVDIPLDDVTYNLGRVALLVIALQEGMHDLLRIATEDRIHQPPRASLLPSMKQLFTAAMEAGALGVFLSGSGPTILALSDEKEKAIADALLSMGNQTGTTGKTLLAKPTPKGAQIISMQ